MLAFLGWSLPLQTAVNGLVLGLGYAVLAAGIVLIYRSSGIVNFAQAAMGAFGVASFVVLVQNYDIPYPLAMGLGVAASVTVGVVTELLVVRRLFDASRVVLLIATVGVAQLLALAILEVLPDFAGGGIPVAFDGDWSNLELADNLVIGSRQTSVLLLVLPVLAALGWFLNRTTLGLHIRAVADNPENARLVGVSPKRVSTLVWGLAAGFAAYTQIALAPIVTRTADELAGVSTIGLLLRALVIALLARMRSIPVVVLGGLALGVVESMVTVNLNRDPGVFNVFLFVFVLVLVLVGSRGGRRDDAGFSVGVTRRPVPEHLARIWWVRRLPTLGMALFLLAALLVPQVVTKSSELLTWTELLIVAMVAVSLSLLTGWAGQLSLGQFAFAGVGGLSMLAFTQGHPLGIGLPWVGHLAEVTIELPWFAALAAATGVGVLFAALVGLPALRVKGLFLAVTTLAFANMAATWMFGRDFWTDGRPTVSSVTRDRPSAGGLEFVDPDSYYYLCLAFLTVTVLVVSRLRRTGSGRAMIAVRDNEPMTSAATISPIRAKLSAFAVSGGIAALAGALYVYLLPGFSPTSPEGPFAAGQSLQLVAIAIIGGIGTVAGPILGALWVVGLPAAFGANDTVRLLSANIGLLVLLLYFPGGLVQILYTGRDTFFDWLATRIPAPSSLPSPAGSSLASSPPGPAPDRVDGDGAAGDGVGDDAAAGVGADGDGRVQLTARERRISVPDEGEPWLEAQQVTVAFDGVKAVDRATFRVYGSELVGLIGTNGAGKSTLMNAVSGFVPHTGTVRVLGHDVSPWPAHRRHAVGLGRGFQDASLFPGLTVRETVLVALEARRHSLLVPSLLALPPSPGVEKHRRAEAEEIITFLGLGDDADQLVADLSTGTRRIMELACLIATDAKVLLLDEPTGGLAQRETEAFPALIRQVQQDLDAAVVVIEHDMPLIMAISDRVYCMEAGEMISSGLPVDVRSDPAVIASYLGTGEPTPGDEVPA